MVRKFMFAVLAAGIASFALMAEEYTGKVTKVDGDKNKITISVKGDDKEFTVTDDTKVVRKGKDGSPKDIKDGIKNKIFSNSEKMPTVTIKTEKKDGKEVVVEVMVKGGKGGGKKKNDN